MKGPRALAIYRSAPGDLPPARVDARILGAARVAAVRSSGRLPLMFAGAMAATVIVAFTTRWFVADPPPADAQEFGLAEGQARSYLLEFDPLITGPGSQEGSP